MDRDLKQAYVTLERNKAIIREYLVGKGHSGGQAQFQRVRTNQRNKALFTARTATTWARSSWATNCPRASPWKVQRWSQVPTHQPRGDRARNCYTNQAGKIETTSKATDDACATDATNAGSRLRR